jgi:hypothetical protein
MTRVQHNPVLPQNDWVLDIECLDEELSVIERQEIFRKRIAHWAVESNASRDSVNKLLAVFRMDQNLSFLPKTYKTLLGTPRKVNRIEISPGRYFEFNLLDGIIASLNKLNASVQSYEAGVKLFVGCDGMPASKSTNSQFWPILGLLKLKGAQPFAIGFYQRQSKPDDANSYLNHFHTEIAYLIANGFDYKGPSRKN